MMNPFSNLRSAAGVRTVHGVLLLLRFHRIQGRLARRVRCARGEPVQQRQVPVVGQFKAEHVRILIAARQPAVACTITW